MNDTFFGWINENSGGGGGSQINKPLNLSDTTIYNVSLNQITIPIALLIAGIFTCEADLYDDTKSYSIDDIVRSDGTFGGDDKKCYKSLSNGNVGNNLNDGINWAYADVLGANVGNIEMGTFGNPNSLPTNHSSAFRVNSGSFGLLFKSGGSNPGIGQLFLDVNTDVLISNQYSEITFAVVFNVSVKQPAPFQ